MNTIRTLFFLALASSLAVFSNGQRDFSNVEITATQVSDSVYMLEGSGGNIGACIGDEGVLLVDDQFEPLADKIEAAIDELAGGKIVYVLNTHHHGDHTGGNPHFGKADATLIAHDNVRQRLASDQEFDDAGLPVITFDHSATLHFNGETIELLHFGPGHTDGDSIIRFVNANVVHMGDLFFNGRFPYVDLGSGGDLDGYASAVESALLRIDEDTKIIPGHGPQGMRAELEAYLDMIKKTSGIVRKGIEEGKSLETLQSENLLEEWSPWGEGWITTERWIETIYNDAVK